MTDENNNDTDVLGNLEKVRGELIKVVHETGRNPQSVSLVAVSKLKLSPTNAPAISSTIIAIAEPL